MNKSLVLTPLGREMHTTPPTIAAAHLVLTPLDIETRTTLPTSETAAHINRRPQTLRQWACMGGGLLTPVRIGSRLAWKVADIRRLVAGE